VCLFTLHVKTTKSVMRATHRMTKNDESYRIALSPSYQAYFNFMSYICNAIDGKSQFSFEDSRLKGLIIRIFIISR
jgi:hypothetical protein